MTAELSRVWPAAGISARAGGLELRWIDDNLLTELADLASRGIHDPDTMPFNVPWTRGTPSEVARSVMAFQWASRAQVGRDRLVLELGVLLDGVPVGIQSASGSGWSIRRQLGTGSWLGREFQGRGIGSRMRALMLHLCFDGLNAAEVTSAAFADNPTSQAVSLRAGYEPNGLAVVERDGEVAVEYRYRLSAERWAVVRQANAELLAAPVELAGVDALRVVVD